MTPTGRTERFAAYLLRLAVEQDSCETVELQMSKAQLSAAVGTVPETFCRASQQLVRA